VKNKQYWKKKLARIGKGHLMKEKMQVGESGWTVSGEGKIRFTDRGKGGEAHSGLT